MKNSRMKNLILFLASAAACAALAEITLRFIAPPAETGAGTLRTPKAALYGWAPAPDSRQVFIDPDTKEASYFTTNREGWKDAGHKLEKPAGAKRILFLGDSGTWGVVSPEFLYTRQAEKILKARKDPRVEVISIGAGGWGTDQELEALRNEGMRYSPDIVIYQFCGNDVTDNLMPDRRFDKPDSILWAKAFKYELKNGRLEKIILRHEASPPTGMERIKKALLKSALVYNLNRAKNGMRSYFQGWKDRGSREAAKAKRWWEEYAIDPFDTYYWHDSIGESAMISMGWALLDALIAEMKRTCESGGAKFMVFSETGEEGEIEWNLKHGRIAQDGGGYYVMRQGARYPIDPKKPVKELKAICGKHGIGFIETKRKYTRYDNDPHPDREGNLRMAEDISDFLIDNKSI